MVWLWLLLIALFLVPIIIGLPEAWRMHKMSALALAIYQATIAFKKLGTTMRQSNKAIQDFSTAFAAAAQKREWMP